MPKIPAILFAMLLFSPMLCSQSGSSIPEARPTTSPLAESSGTIMSDGGSGSVPEDSKGAEPIHKVRPNSPLEGDRQGRVWIKVLISTSGDVKSAEVTSGDPILAQAPLEAAKKWKFKPFIKNGKAVEIHTSIPFDFAYADRIKDFPENSGGSGTATAAPTPFSVPQKIMAGRLIHQVVPVYPYEAKVRGIEGTVLLKARIGKDGLIHDLQPVSGPNLLRETAKGAVEQWRYKPYLRDGEPVEVDTEITVHFTLGR